MVLQSPLIRTLGLVLVFLHRKTTLAFNLQLGILFDFILDISFLLFRIFQTLHIYLCRVLHVKMIIVNFFKYVTFGVII
jgi:hypothetical protein